MIRTLIFIGTGSFIGGIARYLLTYPLGTERYNRFFPFRHLGCQPDRMLVDRSSFRSIRTVRLVQRQSTCFPDHRILWRIHHLLHFCPGKCCHDAQRLRDSDVSLLMVQRRRRYRGGLAGFSHRPQYLTNMVNVCYIKLIQHINANT